MLLKIETGKGLYKENFACQIPIKDNIVFIVTLDTDNTYLILQILLDSFNKLNLNLINLKVKFDFIKDKIPKYNHRTNAVKGFSFYYNADNYFITIDEKQMIEIQETSSWSNDCDSSKKIDIEADILLDAIESNDSHKFYEIIAKN